MTCNLSSVFIRVHPWFRKAEEKAPRSWVRENPVSAALFAILADWEIVKGWEIVVKARLVSFVVAFAFGHAALLLMIHSTNSAVHSVRRLTLGIIVFVAVFALIITLNPLSVAVVWRVFADPVETRINLCDNTDIAWQFATGQEIAKFIDVPFVDLVSGTAHN